MTSHSTRNRLLHKAKTGDNDSQFTMPVDGEEWHDPANPVGMPWFYKDTIYTLQRITPVKGINWQTDRKTGINPKAYFQTVSNDSVDLSEYTWI